MLMMMKKKKRSKKNYIQITIMGLGFLIQERVLLRKNIRGTVTKRALLHTVTKPFFFAANSVSYTTSLFDKVIV
jgi:hypothetical protein